MRGEGWRVADFDVIPHTRTRTDGTPWGVAVASAMGTPSLGRSPFFTAAPSQSLNCRTSDWCVREEFPQLEWLSHLCEGILPSTVIHWSPTLDEMCSVVDACSLWHCSLGILCHHRLHSSWKAAEPSNRSCCGNPSSSHFEAPTLYQGATTTQALSLNLADI